LELELAVINPSLVLGPPLSKRVDSESVNFMRDILSGKFQSGVPRTLLAAVDVRDVAMAHVRAMLDPKAKVGNVQCTSVNIQSTLGNIQSTLGNIQATSGNIQSTFFWPRWMCAMLPRPR
jgi:nucleoside-diphosphate-sugar epimerase